MSTDLTIIQMNDTHGYLEVHPELFWSAGGAVYHNAGGYARIATLLERAREERPGAVLAFDNGDTIHGTYVPVQTRGEALVPILNRLGFAAMTAHWEFAYGPSRFKEIAARLNYPMLAINCYDESAGPGSGSLYFRPYTIVEAAGLRVGVIGIASNIIDKTMPPAFSKGVRFTLGREELPGYVAQLRDQERVDLVIVLSHLGFPQDMQLASEVSGVDVWLSSHTHNRLYQAVRVNGAILIQSGSHGSFLGRLDLQVEDRHVIDFRHELLTVGEGIEPDREIQGLIDDLMAPYRAALGRVVGATATPLHRNTLLESTMDNLLLQSLLDLTGAPLAFSNGWRYGAPIPEGPVTLNDLYNIIPVNPPVSTVQITGDHLWAMLEENLEHTFARDPYRQMGGYLKRALGLKAYIKPENPQGQRLVQLFVANEPVRPGQEYLASFVTKQGVPEKYGRQRQPLETRAVDALERYLGKHGPAEAGPRGTFSLI
jgi:S-sulfosulfanyl-L-cysteine sulfohydrolase